MKLLMLESPVAAPEKHLSKTRFGWKEGWYNLFILSLDPPCPREGEMGFPLWPEVGLLKELAAAVEGAHVVDALAASALPPGQISQTSTTWQIGQQDIEEHLIKRMEARETQQKTARATARPMRRARSASTAWAASLVRDPSLVIVPGSPSKVGELSSRWLGRHIAPVHGFVAW